MEFVSFAILEGKMYRNKSESFIADWTSGDGNHVVYGAIYILKNDYFHLRTLDAMHNCSKSSLGRNHDLDLQHRVTREVTPIQFKCLDELRLLKYTELDKFVVDYYIGNELNQTIRYRISRTQRKNFRIKNGIQKEAFIAQYREVCNGKELL